MVKSVGKSQGKKERTDAPFLEGERNYPGISVGNDVLIQRIMTEIEDYAMVLLTPDGTVASWNRGAEMNKGYTMEEVVGKHCRIFFPKEDKDAELPETLLKAALENGRTNHEGWQIRKDGSRFWANVSITTLHKSGSAEVVGFLTIARDLTNSKITEDNYSNYVEQLKQRNKELKKSEQRYHSMIAEVRDYAIILLDREGKILDWNKGAEALKGYKAGEIIGKSFRLFYPRESKDLNLPEQLLQKAVENDSVYHEGWRIRKDGTRFWGSVAITALHDDDGQITGFSKVTRDLTQRKVIEDQLSNYAEDLKQKIEDLRRSEERYYKMISEVQDYAIILLNEKGEIQNWNQGAERIKGYAAQEVIGKSLRIFYTKEDAAVKLPERLLGEAKESGKVNHEGWRVRKDGSRFWGNVVITALHDEQGNVIGFSKVTRDLTDKKNADDALRTVAAQLDLKNKTLERLNDQLASFTYVASHDLQAPLRKIQFFSGRLSETEPLTEAGKKFVDKINSSAVHMQNLMDDLLSYSQVSNDTSPFEMIDLDRILQTVKSDLEVDISQKKAMIQSSPLPVILGTSYQMHQLFLNLLSNAIKFSKPDEVPLITISCRVIEGPDIPGGLSTSGNKYYHIAIRDNGIGFESEFSDKIFEAFERLHPKNTFTGTGIGLAIVKKVTENHNGIVVAEGAVNVGATFHIYLPCVE